LTAACCPKREIYTSPSPPPSKENATYFCTALCLLVLGIKAWQNLRHKATKLTPKGDKLAAKVCTEHSKFSFLHTK